MAFRLEFETDNEAFDEPDPEIELARILRDVADRMESGAERQGNVRDINGNLVGAFSFR